jgi:transcriptional regulator with XRE-family HTH domain
MNLENFADREVALWLAQELRAWRIDPRGAGMTQTDLASRSGMGLTPLKRFEKTGGITLNNLVALLRALNLLDRLENLIPKPDSPGPLDLLKADREAARRRVRAPRARPAPAAARSRGAKRRG